MDKYSGQFVIHLIHIINNLLKKKNELMILNINLIDFHFSHAQLIFVLKSEFQIRKINTNCFSFINREFLKRFIINIYMIEKGTTMSGFIN